MALLIQLTEGRYLRLPAFGWRAPRRDPRSKGVVPIFSEATQVGVTLSRMACVETSGGVILSRMACIETALEMKMFGNVRARSNVLCQLFVRHFVSTSGSYIPLCRTQSTRCMATNVPQRFSASGLVGKAHLFVFTA